MNSDRRIIQILKQRVADLVEEAAFWQAQFEAAASDRDRFAAILTDAQKRRLEAEMKSAAGKV